MLIQKSEQRGHDLVLSVGKQSPDGDERAGGHLPGLPAAPAAAALQNTTDFNGCCVINKLGIFASATGAESSPFQQQQF